MATVSYTGSATATATRSAPTDWIKVDGRWRSDCKILSVNIASGASNPAEATIAFEDEKYGSDPVGLGVTVAIYLDVTRAGTGAPSFLGSTESIEQSYSPEMGVVYRCVDARRFLEQVVCPRNYNERDSITGYMKEQMTFPAIAWLLINAVNDAALAPYEISLSTAGMSRVVAPTQTLEGLSVGQALDKLLMESSSEESARWAFEYRNAGLRMSVFANGWGPIRRIKYARSATTSFATQYPNTDSIHGEESLVGVVNRVIATGGRNVIQSAFTLTEDWPATLGGVSASDILANPEKYARKYTDWRTENPHYIEGAENVGRCYKIPTVDLYDPTTNLEPGEASSTSAQHPEILSHLIDNSAQPFIVATLRDSMGEVAVTEGFSVQNNERVVFTQPFLPYVKDTVETTTIYSSPIRVDDSTISVLADGIAADDWKGYYIRLQEQTEGEDIALLPIVSFLSNDPRVVVVAKSGDYAQAIAGRSVRLSGGSYRDTQVTPGTILYTETNSQDTDLMNIFVSGIDAISPLAWPKPSMLRIITPLEQSWHTRFSSTVTTNLATIGGAVFVTVGSGPLPLEAEDVDRPWLPVWPTGTLRLQLIAFEPVKYANNTPDAVYLVAAYLDTQRLRVDSGKIGSAPETVTARLTREDYRTATLKSGCWVLDGDGRLSGQTTDDAVIENDTEKLTEYAADYARANANTLSRHSITLPYADTRLGVGTRIKSRSARIDGLSVMSVGHNRQTFDTTLSLGQ